MQSVKICGAPIVGRSILRNTPQLPTAGLVTARDGVTEATAPSLKQLLTHLRATTTLIKHCSMTVVQEDGVQLLLLSLSARPNGDRCQAAAAGGRDDAAAGPRRATEGRFGKGQAPAGALHALLPATIQYGRLMTAAQSEQCICNITAV